MTLKEGEKIIFEQNSTKEFTIRFLERSDHKLGFPAVLSGLTKGCEYGEG